MAIYKCLIHSTRGARGTLVSIDSKRDAESLIRRGVVEKHKAEVERVSDIDAELDRELATMERKGGAKPSDAKKKKG